MPLDTLAALDRPQIARRLAGPGLVLRLGPYLSRIRSPLRELVASTALLYRNYAVADSDRFADFEVRVAPTDPIRTWLKPRIIADIGTPAPFQPLPAVHAPLMLEMALNWSMATRSLDYLILHAGVVERDGRAVVIPGGSGQGKSTLTASLAAAGWRYLTDEFGIVDLDGLDVHPYPRPVSLKNESIPIIQAAAPGEVFSAVLEDTPKGQVAFMAPPGDALALADTPAAPAMIVIPDFTPDAEPDVIVVPRARAFFLLTASSVNYDRFGDRGFEAVAALVDRVPMYQLRYPDLAAAHAMIADLFADL